MKLLTWNVAGRTAVMDRQAEAVARREPDIVCLQEVRASTAPRWREALEKVGLGHALDSSELVAPRRLFNLTASRWELKPLIGILVPQPERVLGVVTDSPWGRLEVWNAHVPPAPSNGLIKAETCEVLFASLARRPRGTGSSAETSTRPGTSRRRARSKPSRRTTQTTRSAGTQLSGRYFSA